MKSFYTYTLLALLSALSVLRGQQTVIVDDQQEIALHRYTELTQSAEGISTWKDFQNARDTLNWRPLESPNENLGFTARDHWLRFKLNFQSQKSRTYVLETARPITDHVTLYHRRPDSSFQVWSTGDQMPFEERPTQERASTFEIQLRQPGKHAFYLHLRSDGEMLSLPMHLQSPTQHATSSGITQLFFGLFYGVVILAGLVYLLFYFGMGDRSFLFYSAYVFSLGFLQFSLDGYVYRFLLPSGGWLNSHMVLIAAAASIVFLALYSQYFLRIHRHLPAFRWPFRGVYMATGALMLLMVGGPTGLQWTYPLINGLGLLTLGVIFSSVLALRRRGIRVDPFYIGGVSFLIFAFVVFILNNMGWVPNNVITIHSSKIGAGLEIVFLSVSMSNRIRQLREEKDATQFTAFQRLEKINELKNHFMSNMSHELRTPLNAILGLAEDMRRQTDPPADWRQNLDIISFSSRSLLSSVDDVFDFSKIEKGELRLDHESFCPPEELEAIAKSWQMQARQKGLSFQAELSPHIPAECRGDGKRLLQITNNLLSNAVKFTAEGEVNLKVDATRLGEQRTEIQILVRDTGERIPQDKQGQIYDSFSQSRFDDKRQHGGMGLGLAIVSKLVELFEGKISFESSPGRGTTFRVQLPMEIISQQPTPVTAPKRDPKPVDQSRVLVVEDNALNQMVMRKMLEGWGMKQVTIAGHGEEALEVLNQEAPFDAILMDLQMPVMDGYEATEAIRQGRAGTQAQECPILAVTADTEEKTRRKVLEIGMQHYISKPVNQEALKNALAEWIDCSSSSEAA